jgi:hypothetical protein
VYALDRQHPLANHLVQLWQDGFHVLRCVNDLDDQRQILAKTKDPRRVQPGVGAEPFDILGALLVR